MKKVLVLAAAVTLFATQAMAASSIIGSKHDLRVGQPGGDSTYVDQNGTTSQVCVFCHTPHGAQTTDPLWNRTGVVANITAEYNSVTLDAVSRPGAVDAAVDASDAPLCITCHDSNSVVDALGNPPNDGTVLFAGGGFGTSALNIDSDLSNDHPIGMPYATVATNAGVAEFQTLATVTAAGLNFYTATNVMWCSSCHDVHDDANAPFLAKSNTASGLCTTCHVK